MLQISPQVTPDFLPSALHTLQPIAILTMHSTLPTASLALESPNMMKIISSSGCYTSKYLSPHFDSSISSANPSLETLPSLPNVEAPHPYHPFLTSIPSPLRPHCLACDRLHLWMLSKITLHNELAPPTNCAMAVSDKQFNHILDVISASWSERTKETYVWHRFIGCLPYILRLKSGP